MPRNSLHGFVRAAWWGCFGVLVVLVSAACDLPFGLGLASTRALEDGAAAALDGAGSFEMSGAYLESGQRFLVDVQLARPDSEHLVVTGSEAASKVEAIVLGKDGYFRGRDFLAQHVGSDPVSQAMLAAAGDAWWKGPAASAPQLPDLTGGDAFQSTFLGSAVTQRGDHVSLDGSDAVYLAGPRAEVWVMSGPPYQPLRVHLRKGVVVDGLADADVRYLNFDHDFGIAVPRNVIDFSNLSSLPPLYTVVSVDVSRCGASGSCVVSAVVKNLGATQPARAHSTITFVMKDNASGKTLGSCMAPVVPDVGFNATTTVQCTISGAGVSPGAETVTATPNNPGRA
jgi:hypothetical protein